jgi:hypothetical protein
MKHPVRASLIPPPRRPPGAPSSHGKTRPERQSVITRVALPSPDTCPTRREDRCSSVSTGPSRLTRCARWTPRQGLSPRHGPPSQDGLDELVGYLGRWATEGELLVGIERPEGRLVDRILEAGYPILLVPTLP